MFLVLTIALMPAQVTAFTVSTGVTSNATAFGSQRKIVRDSAGNLFVVYLKSSSGSSQVILSESSNDGETWNDVGRVSDYNFTAARATIAIDAQNRLHIFWTQFVGEYGQVFYKVYAGGAWSRETQLTSGAAYSGYPSAAFDSKGTLHLVWYGYDGVAYQVFYSHLEGGDWSKPDKLSSGFPDSLNPSIAVDYQGNLHVVWFKNNGHYYQINYIRWSGSWLNQIALSSPYTDAADPTIAVDASGNVHLAWDQGEGQRTQIYYAVYQNGTWAAPFPVISINSGAENPSIGVDSAGTVYVLYDERENGLIYLRQRSQEWSTETQITSGGESSYPNVRWSFFNDFAKDKVDFVWTSKEGGSYQIQFGGFQVNNPNPRKQILRIGPSLQMSALILLVGVAIMVKVSLSGKNVGEPTNS